MTIGTLNTKDKIIRARIQIQRQNPFFAYLSLYLKFHEAEKGELECDTMGVDAAGNLYYNKEFVDKLSDEELQGVLIHEICHLAFLHLSRCGERDHLGWNYAVDIAANNILTNNGYKLPTGGLIPYNNSIDLGMGIKIEDIQKKNAEQIYDELMKQVKKVQNKLGLGNISKKGFDVHLKGDTQSQGKDGKKGKGKLVNGMPLTDAERKEIEEQWKQRALDAATTARMRGSLPAGVDVLLGKLHENRVNWKTMLKQFIQSQIPYDYTYNHCSKKSIASGYYMPDLLKERIKILVAVDTSGSIGDKERVDFVSEIAGMAKAFKDKIEMIFLTHDTQVQNDIVMENGKIAKIQELKLNGGGGTSHEPVMEYITKKHRECKVAIFLTDGYSDLDGFDMNKYRFSKIFVISENGTTSQLKNKNCKTIELDKYKC